jgi:hypothetical protein
VTLDPPSPKPGEEAVIEAVMQTRDDVVIDDSKQLGGVTAAARLAGDGFDPVMVKLHDDGAGPDRKKGDVRFTGSVTVPEDATGALSLTSQMAAPGITGDERPYHTVVTSGPSPLTATAALDDYSVHPGGTVEGTLDARNGSGSTHTLRLQLVGRQGKSLRVIPSEVRVSAGKTKTVRYRLAFGSRTPVGKAGGRIEVVDTTDGGRVVDETPLAAISVTAPPTWWDMWWWAVVGGAALALVAAVVAKVRIDAGRTNRDVAGLTLELRKNGLVESTQKTRRGSSFEFTVDTGGPRPRLSASRSGAGGAYRLTRDRSGGVQIRPPRGKQHSCTGNTLSLGNGFELTLRGGKLSSSAGAAAKSPGRTNPFAVFLSASSNGRSQESSPGDQEGDGRQPARGRESTSAAPGKSRFSDDHF